MDLGNKTCKSRLQKDRVRKMITVKINGEERQYPQGATYEDVTNDYQQEYENLIALAARDGKIRELFKKLTRDCEVTFFTLKDDVGNKTYVRSATMLFLKAVFDVYGRERPRAVVWNLPSATAPTSLQKGRSMQRKKMLQRSVTGCWSWWRQRHLF